MTTKTCASWCLGFHDDDAGCEGEVFQTGALTHAQDLLVGIRDGEEGPVLFVDDPVLPGLPVLELNASQIVQFRDALMEFACRLGACDCGHGPLCVRPDCPGECGRTHE